MIIGNGMIAKAFVAYKKYSNILIFASGVSNSLENKIINFEREEQLLRKTILANKNSTVVYFSTCSIDDKSVNQSQYVMHKLKMESIVKEIATNFFIFRLPQVVGNSNSPIFINFLFNSIIYKKKIDIYKYSTRNLICIKDVFEICDFIITENKFINEITNIATPFNINVFELVTELENLTNNVIKKNILNIGTQCNINIDKLLSLDKNFDIYSSSYTSNLLKEFFITNFK